MTIRVRRCHTLVIATASLIAAASIGTAPAAAGPLAVSVGEFQDGVYIPINDVDLTGAGGATVLANGNLALTWAGSRLEATFGEDDELQSVQSELGLRGAITLDLSAQTDGEIDDTLEVVTLPLAQFAAGPATVTPYLGVNVRISGQADAGAQVSVVAPFNLSAALSRVGGRTSATAPARPSFQPEVGLPDVANAFAFTVIVEVEVTLTFMLAINGFPVGGPVLLAGLGTELGVDPSGVDLDAITSLKYGWSVPDATGVPQPPRRPATLFPRRRFDIALPDVGLPGTNVSTRWSQAYGIDQEDRVGGVVVVGDEITVIEEGRSPSGNPWMASLDGLGNSTWQQQGTQPMTVNDLARTADGDLVAIGGQARIERFAADGTPGWAGEITIDGIETSTWSAVVATDGGVIAAGSVRYTDGVERPIIVDIDNAGEVRWVSEIELGDDMHTDVEIAAIGEAPDGDLLIVGQAEYRPNGGSSTLDALVIRVGRDGTVRHVHTLGHTLVLDIGAPEMITGIAVQSDGSYAIVGSIIRSNGEAPRPLVASFDANDQLLWSSAYLDRSDLEWSSAHALATGITVVNGGDYVVSGRSGLAGDAWLMRIDSSGMPVWAKSYASAEDDQLTDVVTMPTGIAAFGSTQATDADGGVTDDLWVVRTNVDGMIHFDPTSGFDTANGAVQWTPNNDPVVRTIEPDVTTPTVTITDTAFGATPVEAILTSLT